MYAAPSADTYAHPYMWYLETEIKIQNWKFSYFLTGENSEPNISSGDADSVRKGEISFNSSSGSAKRWG